MFQTVWNKAGKFTQVAKTGWKSITSWSKISTLKTRNCEYLKNPETFYLTCIWTITFPVTYYPTETECCFRTWLKLINNKTPLKPLATYLSYEEDTENFFTCFITKIFFLSFPLKFCNLLCTQKHPFAPGSNTLLVTLKTTKITSGINSLHIFSFNSNWISVIIGGYTANHIRIKTLALLNRLQDWN